MYIIMTAFCLMVVSCIFTYTPTLKNSPWLWVGVITTGILMNAGWAWLARLTKDNHTLVMYSIYWDIGLTIIYAIFPIIYLGLPMRLPFYIGLVCVIIGLITMKL